VVAFEVLVVLVVVVLVVVALVVVVVLLAVVVFVVFAVVELLLALTTVPSGEQGKSSSAVLAMFVQKYSELPLVPTNFVPVAEMPWHISLQTKDTTSLFLVPVPVTPM
jgi:hypothetical protein